MDAGETTARMEIAKKGKWPVWGILVALALLSVGVAFWVLRGGKGQEPRTAVTDETPRVDGQVIRFSEAFKTRANVKTGVVEQTSLAPVVTVTGTAAFDPEGLAAVGARIAGRIRTVHKYEGDTVKVGDALAEIESADLGQAQAAVLAARAKADTAKLHEKRTRLLADQKVESEREAELAKEGATAASAELHAAEQRVRALSAGATSELGVLLLKSPIAGKVVERKVSRGQAVEPTLTAFRVANLSTLWIELFVFERELGAVRRGDVVEISPQTNAGVVLRGKVAHVGDVIDLETRSAVVRVEVQNDDEMLRPGQSVIAKIKTSVPVTPGLVILRDAVVTVDGKATVFVARGPNAVEPRAITLGARDATRVEVVQGLAAGEEIVVSGVFALKSELFR